MKQLTLLIDQSKLSQITEVQETLPISKIHDGYINHVVESDYKYLTLNVMRQPVSDHLCYILKSSISNRIYIGYTVNFPRRLRQHNGELVGGAKKTRKWRPWHPICLIKGFYELSSALRFEYHLQHPRRKRKAKENVINFTLENLVSLINNGDRSIMPWPSFQIIWYYSEYSIQHPRISNHYLN